jgi:hypothetical protein
MEPIRHVFRMAECLLFIRLVSGCILTCSKTEQEVRMLNPGKRLCDIKCIAKYIPRTDTFSVNNPWRYRSDEPWPAEQPPLAVFPDCTRRYWVDMWSAHRIPQLYFQLSKPDRYFFIQVTTQFIRSRG